MCRMLAIYGKIDHWKEVVMAFRQQADTGKVPPRKGMLPGHKDGWGMAAADLRGRAMETLIRRPGSAADDPLFEQTLAGIDPQPSIFICHLRKASPGIAVTPENIHPFLAGGWGFVHNGTIYQAEKLPRASDLTPTSSGSDSEYFFHYLLSCLKNRGEPRGMVRVLSEAVSKVDIEYTALNGFLANGRDLFAIRRYRTHAAYYTLYCRQMPGGVLLASEPVSAEGIRREDWALIENNMILKISGDRPRITACRIR